MSFSELNVSWDLMRSFLAVVRQGTLSAAARQLGASQPTIGRHIDELERSFSSSLFVRTPNGFAPTSVALALVEHAEAMENAARALVRVANDKGEAAGKVRIAAAHLIGEHILPPMIAALVAKHRKLSIEIAPLYKREDSLLREADVAIRMTRPTTGDVLARRLGEISYGLFAHRSYVERNGAPSSPEQLIDHIFIGFDRNDMDLTCLNRRGVSVTRDSFTIRTDSEIAQLALLRAGGGIGPCMVQVAREYDELIPILPAQLTFAFEWWLAMHGSLRLGGPARLVFDWLAESLTRYVKKEPGA